MYGIAYAVASIGCTIGLFIATVFSTTRRDGLASGVGNMLAYGAGMALLVSALTIALASANTGLLKLLRGSLQYVDRIAAVFVTLSGFYLLCVAILDRGDREARLRSAPEESRFLPLFRALANLGAQPERAVYDEAFADEVHRQLVSVDAVLVWVNPLQDGRDRSALDAILREVAAAGVFVSGHPDVIAKLGTKEVLYTTRDIGWGLTLHLYRSAAQMRDELLARLVGGARARAFRGNGGTGVWKVERERNGTRRFPSVNSFPPADKRKA